MYIKTLYQTWHNIVFSKNKSKIYHASFLQKSSVPSLAPPCECLNTGFQNCMLYPSGFCDCSASCSFVKDYLQDEDQGNDRTEMVSMRSFSGLMTPIDGDGGKFSPSELQNTLEVSFIWKCGSFSECVSIFKMWKVS